MLRELPVFRPGPYTLELDGEVWSTEAMLVAVGNGPSYGGGMRVSPDARLDDGLLDVIVVGPVSSAEFLRIFPRVYAGTHVDHPAVTVRRARSVTVAARRDRRLRRRRAVRPAAADHRGGAGRAPACSPAGQPTVPRPAGPAAARYVAW